MNYILAMNVLILIFFSGAAFCCFKEDKSYGDNFRFYKRYSEGFGTTAVVAALLNGVVSLGVIVWRLW